MTSHHFSNQPLPSAESRDPGDQLIRLSAAWRRKRQLDDSGDNLAFSATAVLRAKPELAKFYSDRPRIVANAKNDADPFADIPLFDAEGL